jgi:FkbM family methyltransferase
MLLRALKDVVAVPFHGTVYPIKAGLAQGLKRRGGLGFLARRRALTTEESFLSRVPLLGSTVYDVGCLDGMYTLFFARAVGPGGAVVAFEPNPKNCAAIRSNVSLNGFENVRLQEIGLGAAAAQAELIIPDGFPGEGTLDSALQRHYQTHSRTERVTVRIERLDDVVESRRLPPPDVIKIDVEGFELQVLEGAMNTLRDRRPKLFIELHGLEPAARVRNIRRILDLLKGVGYDSPLHVESARTIAELSEPPYEGHLWFA